MSQPDRHPAEPAEDLPPCTDLERKLEQQLLACIGWAACRPDGIHEAEAIRIALDLDPRLLAVDAHRIILMALQRHLRDWGASTWICLAEELAYDGEDEALALVPDLMEVDGWPAVVPALVGRLTAVAEAHGRLRRSYHELEEFVAAYLGGFD